MKFKKLLVLSVLWLAASSAMAAIVDGVRVKPTPSATQGFVVSESTDTYFYLYNVDAQAFFTEGNAWGTQVSLGSTGLKAAFTPDGTYDLTYLFNDFSIAKNAWKLVFFDNENQMFVDLGNQANYRWGVEDNGETFRLYAASEENGNPGWAATTDEDGNEVLHPAYREGQYMGWDKASSGNTCVPYLTVADGHCINWAFVTEEVYTAYQAEIVCYEAAEKLMKAIEEYESKGFTATADYKTLYANEAATKAELEKALEELSAAYLEWGKSNASVENPADLTAKIVNPHFDNGDCTTGWSHADGFDAFGRGGTVADGAEHYSKNYDSYQTISGLTPGVYAVGVYGFYRSGNYDGTAQSHWLANDEASKYAKLYATSGDVTRTTPIANVMSGAQTENPGGNAVTYTDPETGEEVTVYVPNTMAQGDTYFHTLNQYANKVFIAVGESGELTIGVKKSSQIGGDWSLFDDFSLTYYGAGADAYQLLLNEVLKDYSEVTIDEGTVYTESYLTAYEETLKGEKTATTQAEVDQIFGSIDGAYNALQKNIQLWKDWQDMLDNIEKKYLLTDDYAGIEPEIDDLADYVMYKDDYLMEEWTNEELQAEIDKVTEWETSLIDKSKKDVWDGKNMSQYITNPGFDEDKDINSGGAEGWTIDAGTGTNITRGPLGQGNQDVMINALGEKNFCFEAWHRYNWDVWQEVKNLPVGMYELQVQGYVRCEMSGYNRGDELVDPYTSPVYLYMNNAMSQFPSVYSENIAEEHFLEDGTLPKVEDHSWTDPAGPTYPNSMGAASLCFGWGMYKTTAYGLIAKEGDTFRIGVKMVNNTDWWCIWDSFKLIYREPTVDIVKPELEKAIAQIDLTQPMGKSVYAKATELIAAANAAKESNDAKAMFNALADLYELSGEIIASTAKFTALQASVVELDDAAFASDSPAKNEAQALVSEINGGIASHSYEDAEVEGLQNQIAAMFTKLNMPNDMASASDENPIECTTVMKSPSFEDENMMNSSTGWTNPGNLGNDDTQKAALAMEFWQSAFDMYQTIYGLPKGTYRLTVDAWCRNGGNADNYKEWVADNKATMAYVYAVDGDSTVYAAPVANVMAGAISDEDPGIDGVASETIEGTTYYLPNSLIGGWSYIQYQSEPVYTNEVICKVGDDGKLTVGMKKAEYRGNSWVVLDNFRLFYLGANSSATPSDDGTAINTLENGVAAVKVEFFNLNGARINKPGKGVALMKQTLSDGSVKLQKVIIK